MLILAATDAETVPIIYVEADGTEKEVQAGIGQNLLEVAHDNGVELEGKLTSIDSQCSWVLDAMIE